MTVSEKDRKNWLTNPPAKPSGRKTATVVNVLAVIAPATSRGPCEDGRHPVVAERPMAVDVLEDDDRIVDHPADGDREAAEGQDVQRDPGDLHDHERGQDRERDADGGDEGRADVDQEQEDRDDGEDRAEAALAQQALARLEDEGRLVGDGRRSSISPGWRAAISSSFAWTASATATVFAVLVLLTEIVTAGWPLVRP